jgi:hypothetical protein
MTLPDGSLTNAASATATAATCTSEDGLVAGWSQRRRSRRAAKFKGAKGIMANKNDQKGPLAKANSGQF